MKDWNCTSFGVFVVSGTCNCLLTKEGKTRPGQSHSLTDDVRKMVWKCLVWPGVREVLTAWKQARKKASSRLEGRNHLTAVHHSA